MHFNRQLTFRFWLIVRSISLSSSTMEKKIFSPYVDHAILTSRTVIKKLKVNYDFKRHLVINKTISTTIFIHVFYLVAWIRCVKSLNTSDDCDHLSDFHWKSIKQKLNDRRLNCTKIKWTPLKCRFRNDQNTWDLYFLCLALVTVIFSS